MAMVPEVHALEEVHRAAAVEADALAEGLGQAIRGLGEPVWRPPSEHPRMSKTLLCASRSVYKTWKVYQPLAEIETSDSRRHKATLHNP